MTTEPLISIVTPVYNGEKYLRECISSVLNQTYQNWEYIIVDNCSTDSTPSIIHEYVEKDSRIRTVKNTKVLPIMENWNLMLTRMSGQSAYCKVVHADDWLFPECISKMVANGEANTSVGIIGAYSQWEERIGCAGLPYSTTILSGHEICRLTLLKRVYPFLSPSSLMIRSSLIRDRDPFYKGDYLHADVEACYELLQYYDFGFVHEILTFIRRHNDSATSVSAKPLNKLILQNLDLLLRFGPVYLNEEEYRLQLKYFLTRYYRFLAKSIMARRENAFWEYHRKAMVKMGLPLQIFKLRLAWFLEMNRRVIHKLENWIFNTKS